METLGESRSRSTSDEVEDVEGDMGPVWLWWAWDGRISLSLGDEGWEGDMALVLGVSGVTGDRGDVDVTSMEVMVDS